MTELGNRLKEARTAKGLSLDDLQNITKIQKRYLAGIEEGDYSAMPGDFYARAFIKQYAEAVELDPDEIFETYKSEIPSTYNEDLPEQLSRVKTRKNLSDGSSKILDVLPKVLIGILIVGIAALVYYFLQLHAANSASESTNKPKSESVNFAKKNLDKAKTIDQAKKQTGSNGQSSQKKPNTANDTAARQQISVVQSSGSSTIYSVNNADKFVLKLVSKGKTWVNIKNGKDSSIFQGMLTKGHSVRKDFSNESKAVLVVGNTIDTDIYVNDQKVDYAVKPTQVVLQNITIQYVPKNK